jgi:hypothetical protein
VLNRNLVIDDDGVGKAGPIKGAVDFGPDHGLVAAVGHVDDLKRDQGSEDLAVAPGFDRGAAVKLSANIVGNIDILSQIAVALQ